MNDNHHMQNVNDHCHFVNDVFHRQENPGNDKARLPDPGLVAIWREAANLFAYGYDRTIAKCHKVFRVTLGFYGYKLQYIRLIQ
jgi:hypothetical protein